MVEVIQNMQRDANREFVPVTADCMTAAYEQCVAEFYVQCLQRPIEIRVGTGMRSTSSTNGLVQWLTTSAHFGGNVKVTASKQELVPLPLRKLLLQCFVDAAGLGNGGELLADVLPYARRAAATQNEHALDTIFPEIRAIRERMKNQIERLNRIHGLESQRPYNELQTVLRQKDAV
ncbi:hypothetical protein H2199_004670 [Coniosporium tulheliwenetii]|uniref:Uncharacterized protein n=1 Tax=Coniosporium tulheliwenetii TaxID=3383036 RepID=A0ACC2Z3V1_9PEZI|nr:hypothetical protein H2199_004670 [Cladosporium sp. JES 115]